MKLWKMYSVFAFSLVLLMGPHRLIGSEKKNEQFDRSQIIKKHEHMGAKIISDVKKNPFELVLESGDGKKLHVWLKNKTNKPELYCKDVYFHVASLSILGNQGKVQAVIPPITPAIPTVGDYNWLAADGKIALESSTFQRNDDGTFILKWAYYHYRLNPGKYKIHANWGNYQQYEYPWPLPSGATFWSGDLTSNSVEIEL